MEEEEQKIIINILRDTGVTQFFSDNSMTGVSSVLLQEVELGVISVPIHKIYSTYVYYSQTSYLAG